MVVGRVDRHHEPDRAACRLRPRRAHDARRCKQADGTYRIFGTKIFITYGDHELTENIIHLVLARLPDAPPGTRGISLFLVPKCLVNADGSLGARNDVVCAGLEHKLGIHASPTCVMKYGEKRRRGRLPRRRGEPRPQRHVHHDERGAARGRRAGRRDRRAGDAARASPTPRSAARAAPPRQAGGEMAPIIEHADIRRTLLTMKALTQAARAICLVTARETRRRAPRPRTRPSAGRRRHASALLTPIAKAFSTDIGCEVASIGVQIHGGMGFIEETGAAQHYRDARILPIYEGTNGIQAIDLVTRKLPLEGGKVVEAYIAELAQTVDEVRASNRPEFGRMGERLGEAVAALAEATRWMGGALQNEPGGGAGRCPALSAAVRPRGGRHLSRARRAGRVRDGGTDSAGRIAIARFFAENLATAAPGLADTVTTGAETVVSAAV